MSCLRSHRPGGFPGGRVIPATARGGQQGHGKALEPQTSIEAVSEGALG